MNDLSFTGWLSSGAPALWAGFFMLAAWMVRTWPAWKQKITEAKSADDTIVGNQWKRFHEEIGRLVQRVKTLEDKCAALEREVTECHDREANERAGRLEAEALLMGHGRANQEAQRIVSTEREADRNKDRKK